MLGRRVLGRVGVRAAPGRAFTAIDAPSVRLLLGYAICFIAVLIAGAIVSFLMRKLIAGSGLSGSDRLLGMVFGLMRGLALVTLIVLLLGFTPLPRDPWWQQSQLLPTFPAGRALAVGAICRRK